jgi:hypothetical protein
LVTLKDSYGFGPAQVSPDSDTPLLQGFHPLPGFWTFVKPDCRRIMGARATEDLPDSGPGDRPVAHSARLTARYQLERWQAWRTKIEMSDRLLRIGKGDHFGVGQRAIG